MEVTTLVVMLSVNACDTIFEFNNSELTVKPSGITNNMLHGNIANNKLANASVSFGNVTLELGQSDATPALIYENANG